MNIQDSVTQAVRGFVWKAQRSAIAYSICALSVMLGYSKSRRR
jgi:hypothetical protein